MTSTFSKITAAFARSKPKAAVDEIPAQSVARENLEDWEVLETTTADTAEDRPFSIAEYYAKLKREVPNCLWYDLTAEQAHDAVESDLQDYITDNFFYETNQNRCRQHPSWADQNRMLSKLSRGRIGDQKHAAEIEDGRKRTVLRLLKKLMDSQERSGVRLVLNDIIRGEYKQEMGLLGWPVKELLAEIDNKK